VYQSDRNTSRYVNAHALPVFQREAIKAQIAAVDFVSGATLTSEAYNKSLFTRPDPRPFDPSRFVNKSIEPADLEALPAPRSPMGPVRDCPA
jgi:hypothetical protein